MENDKIIIYADGACSGNPGLSGIGILLIYKEYKKEISEFIGNATNNIAELTAIKRALIELKIFNKPIIIYTDSNYSIGVLTKNWKIVKNKELIYEIKDLINKFSDIKFVHVKGHFGINGNEIVDKLATDAIKKNK